MKYREMINRVKALEAQHEKMLLDVLSNSTHCANVDALNEKVRNSRLWVIIENVPDKLTKLNEHINDLRNLLKAYEDWHDDISTINSIISQQLEMEIGE